MSESINLDDLAAALEWIGSIDNGSGQICQLNEHGKPVLILFEFGCPACSEVAPKNAEEYGNALVQIVDAARAYLDQQRAQQHRTQEQDEDRRGWLKMSSGEEIP